MPLFKTPNMYRLLLLNSASLILRLLSLVVLLAGLVPAPALAQVQWKMATEYPESNISGVGLATFGKLLASGTHGYVTTVIGFDNALKVSSGDMVRAAGNNVISGGDAFVGPLEPYDPIFGLPSLPFIVSSVDVAKTLNTKARPLYERALAAQGLKLLYVTFWPPTGIWSDRPLRSAEDLKALSVRAYDTTSADVMRNVAGHSEFLTFGEAVIRIKTHTLNAILTSGDGGAGRKLWEDLRYFTPINYAFPISIAFVRQEDFNALPKPVQDQVEDAAAETERSQLALLVNRTAENYQRMRSNGVNIDEPASASVIVALKNAGHGPVAAWRAKASRDAAAILEWAEQQ